jgi:hypothetical protein
MLRTLFHVVLSVPAGFFAGSTWVSLAMSVAGGGNSHNDIFARALWGLGGSVLAPILLLLLKGLRDAQKDGGVSSQEQARRSVMFVLALVLLFAATTLQYYAADIAELAPERGGPVPENPGAVRRSRASWGAALTFLGGLGLAFLRYRVSRAT